MPKTAAVLYDGDCPLCRASVRWLRRLDWRRRLRFENLRRPEVLARYPAVDRDRARERMHLVPPDGPGLDGFHALRWIAGRLPALWPLWPFLRLPGAAAIGVRLYDTVARHRFLFSRCDAGHCDPPPPEPPSR